MSKAKAKAKDAAPEQEGVLSAEQKEAVFNAFLSKRMELANKAGKSFGGKRDLYDALGYKEEIKVRDFLAIYERQDLARRAIDLPSQDSWKKPPIIKDGDARSDKLDKDVTDFVKEFSALAKRLRLWSYFERVDRLSGVGRYAVLLIGIKGHDDFEKPLNEHVVDTGGEGDNESNGGVDYNSIVYLKVFSEAVATIHTKVDNPGEPRFGLPLLYKIKGDDFDEKLVHYSRIIHIAEDKTESEIYGTPRLQAVYNRLQDLDKVIGSSAEAFWLNIRKGMVFSADANSKMPEAGTPQYQAMIDEIEQYVHGINRFMRLSGIEVDELGADPASPGDTYDVLIEVVAGALGIPKRIFVGSERGELASSQDERNWAGQISSRQASFCEPDILDAFINWLFKYTNFPIPQNNEGEYETEWQSNYELNEKERADIAKLVAEALAEFTGGFAYEFMPIADFMSLYLQYELPEDWQNEIVARAITPTGDEDVPDEEDESTEDEQ